ncbi:glutamate ABC transporter substrate-binding protein [Oribacterium sp. WCC10]|uniref:glutamate ABC transporter substrate-binding protein n=1 Tax=Oribacterium sp. WCC10 TaxID=1855343 RepID=UPI0008E8ABA8|nr:glutamate ABC transporter substrate-binding protein [Oribacterium sp. WCC10]SFG77622.1 amino acid ABC transporter substrate-binding protein, PAAT family [Oribacterium sp. WCC10]
MKKSYKRLFAGLLISASVAGLTACGGVSSTPTASTSATTAAVTEAASEASTTEAAEETTKAQEVAEPQAAPIDKAAFDELLTKGPVASDDEIAASEWAKAVKEAGVLRVGGTRTSQLFSQLDETDNGVRGFDAGLYQLLARYILGDESKYEITQVDSSTRESVLTTGQVDAVFATYSITDKRKELISFAGPYYTSRQAVLVKAGNSDITGVDDLAGKVVATQAGSTGPAILEEYAPEATVQEFSSDIEARTALEQGRVDAYVTDYTLMLNALVKETGKYEIAGDVFGPEDNYGIGLPKDSDGVEFVNSFLKKIEEEGLWKDLWKVSLGDRTGISDAPEAPAVG